MGVILFASYHHGAGQLQSQRVGSNGLERQELSISGAVFQRVNGYQEIRY